MAYAAVTHHAAGFVDGNFWYGLVPEVRLLSATVTSFNDGATRTIVGQDPVSDGTWWRQADLGSAEIPTGGGYTAGDGGGITMAPITGHAVSRTVYELCYTAAVWPSTTNLSVTFRWALLCRQDTYSDGVIFGAYDFGAAGVTLTNAPLTIPLPPSTNVPGLFTVARMVAGS